MAADNQMFQYFITVVPTKLNTHKISADTHQFSVTERVRETEFVSRVGGGWRGLSEHSPAVCFPRSG